MKFINSHQISQTVLKKFSRNGEVLFVNKETGTKSLVEPRYTAHVRLPETIIGQLEKQWGKEIESDLDKVYRALDRGDFFASTHLKSRLKGIMALHYVRSFQSLRLLDKIGREKVKELMKEIKSSMPKMSEEDYQQNYKAIQAKMFTEVYIESLKSLIPKVKSFFDSKNFEIGYTDKYKKLVISDIPVIGITDNHKLAALEGIALMNCSGIAMPISPNYLVSLTTEAEKKELIPLTNSQVGHANDKSIAQSIAGYYEMPPKSS